MITQHVVSYGDDVTLTRLPAGRAEGYVWLFFVASGTSVPDADGWRIDDHLRLTWLDGSTAEVTASAATGAESLRLFELTIRDAGYNTLTIGYIDDGRLLGSENVALPVDPT